MENFIKALEINPNHILALDRLTDCYVNENKWNEAVECAQLIVDLLPDDLNYLYLLASAQADAKRFEDCVKNLRKSHELEPESIVENMRYRLNSTFKKAKKKYSRNS